MLVYSGLIQGWFSPFNFGHLVCTSVPIFCFSQFGQVCQCIIPPLWTIVCSHSFNKAIYCVSVVVTNVTGTAACHLNATSRNTTISCAQNQLLCECQDRYMNGHHRVTGVLPLRLTSSSPRLPTASPPPTLSQTHHTLPIPLLPTSID